MVQKRWPDASLARCEQTVMLGFFEVRKLIDSRKLTRDFALQPLQVKFHRPTGKCIHLFNRRNIEELYDFDGGRRRTITVQYLCNQVIHSYVFALVFDEINQFQSVVVASDLARSKDLIEVPVTTIVEVFDRAGGVRANDQLRV
jgi:hypothetical protein